jgi:hypothetical protein
MYQHGRPNSTNQPRHDDGDGQNVPIHNTQVVQGADGGINLKVKQTKLPEFWGKKEKDSIAPNEFIKRIYNMAAANAWSDHIAFWNFALALRGSANTWLEPQVKLEDITGDRRAWTIIQPLFMRNLQPNQMTSSSLMDWPIWP